MEMMSRGSALVVPVKEASRVRPYRVMVEGMVEALLEAAVLLRIIHHHHHQSGSISSQRVVITQYMFGTPYV